MTLLFLLACGPKLGTPSVTYGDTVALPLVRVSTDRKRWYVPVTANERTWVFFVDTGYSYTTCDDDFIRALSLTERGQTWIYGEVGRLRATRAALPDFMIGDHRIAGLACVVRDLNTTSSLEDPPEVPIAGVIGIDVFRAFRTHIDPHSATVQFADPRALPRLPDEGDGIVRLRREGRVGIRTVVPLVVPPKTHWALLDTGASSTHLNGTRLDVEPAIIRRNVVVRGTGSTGTATRDLLYYDLDEVYLGGLAIGPLRVVHRKRFFSQGLLGLDALGALHQEYDFSSRRVRFTETTPRVLPAFSDWHGSPAIVFPAPAAVSPP